MAWDLQPDRPIYAQLLERLQLRILTGQYLAGSKLPSVRELAEEAAVNANTMQRALTELEESGLVYAQRTAGRFITADQSKIDTMRGAHAQMQMAAYLQAMQELGIASPDALKMLAAYLAKEEK